MSSSLNFKNKGEVSEHILGLELIKDALGQVLLIAEGKIRDKLEKGAIEERDFERLLKEVRTRLGDGKLKFAPLGDWCALSLNDGVVRELESPNEAIEELDRLKGKYSRYNSTANDRDKPRTKLERVAGPIVEYRTISLPDFTSNALMKAVGQGIIPGPVFKSWFLNLVELLSRQFEESTRYNKALRGLRVRLFIAHPQQGVLHFHIAFTKVDDGGNRLGLIGQKGPKGGGGRLVVNDLGMWAIAMRRLRKLHFEPVPMALKKDGVSSVICGWELLDHRLIRCTELKATETGRARDLGLGPTWDMQLNDSLDAEIAKLRVEYPELDRICVEEEAVARSENAAKAQDARYELGITAKVDNLQLAKRLDEANGQLAGLRNTLADSDVQLAAAREDGKIVAERMAHVEGCLQQAVQLTGPLTPAMLREVDEAWWRSVYGLNTAAHEGYLTETFFRRIKSEITMMNPAFGGEFYNFQVLGERLCPTVFEPSAVKTLPHPAMEIQEPRASTARTLTRDLLERVAQAWELSYYGLPTAGYEMYLTDDFMKWIALELTCENSVSAEDGGYVKLLGEQLRPELFKGKDTSPLKSQKSGEFSGEIDDLETVGERLPAGVFEPSAAQTVSKQTQEPKDPAASDLRTLSRELLERVVEAWEISYYGLPTTGYEKYLTDDLIKWIALEQRSENPVFGEDGGYVQLLGEQLRPGFFKGIHSLLPKDQMAVEERDDPTQKVGQSVEFNR
jgi:hypothetical protein